MAYIIPQVLAILQQIPKKVNIYILVSKYTYINIRYRAGTRQVNTLPNNHAREGHEVYFEGHEGKEMSLGGTA